MRKATLFFALAIAAGAQADRLISIPTAHKLPDWTWQAEGFYNPAAVQWQIGYIGVALPPSYEVAFHNERFGGGSGGNTFDFTYNLLSPVTGIAPGIAFGVQDAMNSTPDHRRYFLAITTSTPEDLDLSHHLSAQTTLGVFTGARTSPFLGMSIPFGTSLRLLIEDNGYRPAFGWELKVHRYGAIRYILRDRSSFITFQLTGKL